MKVLFNNNKMCLVFAGLFIGSRLLAGLAVLEEEFESPDASTVTSEMLPLSGKWASNQSYNGIKKRIWDEGYTWSLSAPAGMSNSTFSTSNGSQAYVFLYSSAVGITSKAGVLGTYDGSSKHHLELLLGCPSTIASTGVKVTLYAINTAVVSNADRANGNFNGNLGTAAIELMNKTFGETNSVLQEKIWEIELNPPGAYAGWDLALRIQATDFNYPIIDNLIFDPPPQGTVIILK